MAHTITNFGSYFPRVEFCQQESIVCQRGPNNFKTVTLTGAPEFTKFYLQQRKRLFFVSRLPAIWFLHCSEDACIGKDTLNRASCNSAILRICRSRLSAACGSWMGMKLPFALSYFILSHVSIQEAISLAFGAILFIHLGAIPSATVDDGHVIAPSDTPF